MKKASYIIPILLIGLVFNQFAPSTIGQEKLKVPLSEIKPECHDKIDLSKSEFLLFEVGKSCVTDEWLNKNDLEEEKGNATKRRVTKGDYRIEVSMGSERDAVEFTWPGQLSEDEDNIFRIKVYEESYLHESYIDGEKKTTVTFVISYRNRSRWGKAIKNLPKETPKGPYGHPLEKAEVPVEKKGEKWAGEVKIHLKRSVKHIDVWKNPDTPDEGRYGIHVKLKPKGKIGKVAEGQPNLEEVVEVIDTPEELVKFMNFYFVNEFHEGHTAYTPRKFLELKKGNCKDYSVFGGYILKENGYKAKQLTYSAKKEGGAHDILLYWDNGEMYYITKRGYRPHIFGPFADSDYEAVIQKEKERRPDLLPGDKINCYAVGPPTKLAIEKPCLYTPPGE